MQSKDRYLKFFIVGFAIIIAASCVNHDLDNLEEEECLTSISYSDDVRPIVMAKCAIPNCHNGDNGSDKNWTEFEKFRDHRATVKEYVKNHIMPPPTSPAGALSEDQIQTISCWVDQGGLNN